MAVSSTSFKPGNQAAKGNSKKRQMRVIYSDLGLSFAKNDSTRYIEKLKYLAFDHEKPEVNLKALSLIKDIFIPPEKEDPLDQNNINIPLTSEEFNKVANFLETFVPKDKVQDFIYNSQRLSDFINQLKETRSNDN